MTRFSHSLFVNVHVETGIFGVDEATWRYNFQIEADESLLISQVSISQHNLPGRNLIISKEVLYSTPSFLLVRRNSFNYSHYRTPPPMELLPFNNFIFLQFLADKLIPTWSAPGAGVDAPKTEGRVESWAVFGVTV